MKLSFSLSSKSSSSKPSVVKPSQKFNDDVRNINEEEKSKVFVTEFDATKPLADSQKSNNLVIAPIANEWRPVKKMKNLELPITQATDSELQFELESHAAADANDSNISYGLNLRQSANSSMVSKHGGEPESQDGLHQQRVRPEVALLQKFKDDLKRLPEDRGFEDFEEVPVEGFAAALLSGYGWREGLGIGKNAKEDIKGVQYEKRTDKQGLGFVSDVAMTHSERDKEIEKEKERERDKGRVREDMNGERNRDRERDREIEKRKEKEKERERDKGRVREDMNGERNRDRGRDREKYTEGPQKEEIVKKYRELKIREGDRKDEGKGKRKSRQVEQEERGRTNHSQMSWLTSHIRVRIISRDLKGGRLYKKKGEVVDVVGPGMCDLSMDDSRELVQGVSQDFLETALPRRGGPVLILSGKHKGVYGNLVERDIDKEIAVVQDSDSHALLNVRLDQIAEFVGDPSYLGY